MTDTLQRVEESIDKATKMIIKLHDRNAQLNLVIVNLYSLFESKKQDINQEVWAEIIEILEEIIIETE
jgi:hypothetical protein